MSDPHNIEEGGHVPADVDPFIPTGICRICAEAEAAEGGEQ